MDYAIRATAADDRVRAFAAQSAQLTEQARQIHGTSPVVTAALGRLLTGGVMMGLMMKGEKDLLTLQIRCDGPVGGLIVTADSAGNVKGTIREPRVDLPVNSQGKLDVGGAVGHGTLQVIRDLGLKEPYIGSCELQTGEIGDDLTYYFSTSEQVPSAVGLGVLVDRDQSVRRAGGFILQLMPDTPEEVISLLEERLTKTPSVTAMLDAGMLPEDILAGLLEDLDPQILEKNEIRYHCDCSRERVGRALCSIGKKELEEMIAEGKTIEVGCQFCGKQYPFTVEDLQEMLRVAVLP